MVRRAHNQREDREMLNWKRRLKGQVIIVFKLLEQKIY